MGLGELLTFLDLKKMNSEEGKIHAWERGEQVGLQKGVNGKRICLK